MQFLNGELVMVISMVLYVRNSSSNFVKDLSLTWLLQFWIIATWCETFLHYCHICVPSEKSFDVVHTHITSAATWRLLVLLIQLLAEIDGRHIIRKWVYLKPVSFQSLCSGLKINSVVKAISPGVECSLYVDDFLSCYIYFDKWHLCNVRWDWMACICADVPLRTYSVSLSHII